MFEPWVNVWEQFLNSWHFIFGTRRNNDFESRHRGDVFPIYPGTEPDTIFLTLKIDPLRSLDVPQAPRASMWTLLFWCNSSFNLGLFVLIRDSAHSSSSDHSWRRVGAPHMLLCSTSVYPQSPRPLWLCYPKLQSRHRSGRSTFYFNNWQPFIHFQQLAEEWRQTSASIRHRVSWASILPAEFRLLNQASLHICFIFSNVIRHSKLYVNLLFQNVIGLFANHGFPFPFMPPSIHLSTTGGYTYPSLAITADDFQSFLLSSLVLVLNQAQWLSIIYKVAWISHRPWTQEEK